MHNKILINNQKQSHLKQLEQHLLNKMLLQMLLQVNKLSELLQLLAKKMLMTQLEQLLLNKMLLQMLLQVNKLLLVQLDQIQQVLT